MKSRKGLFSGWKEVYAFTFEQAVSLKSFKITTIGVALVLFLLVGSINVILAVKDKEKEPAKLTMESVVFYDETGILGNNTPVLTNDEGEEIKGIEYELADAKENEKADVLEKCAKKKNCVMVRIYEEEEYVIEMLVPKDCDVSKKSGKELLKSVENYFKINKIMSTGEDVDTLMKIMMPVNISRSIAGEEEDTLGEEIIKMLLPMVFSFFMYMMLLIYGQSISKSVISEKVSMLMEPMLPSVKPYAIITGKVFGMCTVAIAQFVIWVAAVIGGFFAGDVVAKAVNPGHDNIVLEAINFVREDAGSAFSVSSIVIFVILACIGFVMYCVFAALVSSGVKRAEELNGPLAIYNIIVIIGFFMSYMLPLSVNTGKIEFINYIPLTAVFKLPVDVLLNNVNNITTTIGSAIIVVFTMVLIIVTGKIYKKKVF